MDPAYATYVETHVSYNDLRAFICEDPDDLEMFMSIMCDERHLKINVVKVPQRNLSEFQPIYPLDALRCILMNIYIYNI